MAGTSLGPAIDYLVTSLPTPMTAAVATAVVVDGLHSDVVSDSMIYIGRTEQPAQTRAVTGNQVFPTFGTRQIDETFTIDCFIECQRDGMRIKPARDAVLAMYDVVVHLMVGDPSMGGALRSEFGKVQNFNLFYPTSLPASSMGARASATLTIVAKNRYGSLP